MPKTAGAFATTAASAVFGLTGIAALGALSFQLYQNHN
jgi:hypothetical protein